MAKGTIYKFRLDDEEAARFEQMARERGITRVGLIREALGLDRSEEVAPAMSKERPDSKKEPGAAGIVEVADRVERKRARKEG